METSVRYCFRFSRCSSAGLKFSPAQSLLLSSRCCVLFILEHSEELKFFGLIYLKTERWDRTKYVFGSGWEESLHSDFDKSKHIDYEMLHVSSSVLHSCHCWHWDMISYLEHSWFTVHWAQTWLCPEPWCVCTKFILFSFSKISAELQQMMIVFNRWVRERRCWKVAVGSEDVLRSGW